MGIQVTEVPIRRIYIDPRPRFFNLNLKSLTRPSHPRPDLGGSGSEPRFAQRLGGTRLVLQAGSDWAAVSDGGNLHPTL